MWSEFEKILISPLPILTEINEKNIHLKLDLPDTFIFLCTFCSKLSWPLKCYYFFGKKLVTNMLFGNIYVLNSAAFSLQNLVLLSVLKGKTFCSAKLDASKILYGFAIVKIGMPPNIQWTAITKTTKNRTQRQLWDWLFQETNPNQQERDI